MEDDACQELQCKWPNCNYAICIYAILLGVTAVIAQLGERKTEDLKVSGSIPDCGNRFDKITFSEKNMFVYDY